MKISNVNEFTRSSGSYNLYFLQALVQVSLGRFYNLKEAEPVSTQAELPETEQAPEAN